jgi:hypothetical protein
MPNAKAQSPNEVITESKCHPELVSGSLIIEILKQVQNDKTQTSVKALTLAVFKHY